MRFFVSTIVVAICSFTLTGCGGSSSAEVGHESSAAVSIDRSKYVLAEEPDEVVGVIAARANANHGDPIVVVGRIGGSTNPWVEGRAAFMLLDASVIVVPNGTKPSADNQICMDDCCAIQRAASTTLVKIVDDRGTVLPVDARKLFGVVADDMVVVQGKVNKDEAGNFVVLASGVHVRK